MSSEQIFTESPPGFDAAEMVNCGACSRPNPPTRLKCFYCSAELETKATVVKFDLRRLEPWERGINIVVMPRDKPAPDDDEAARLFSTLGVDLASVISTANPLPIARVESTREAELLTERLAGLGFDIRIVDDAELDPDNPPVRLRGLSLAEGRLELHPISEQPPLAIATSDVVLIVSGSIYSTRTETVERRKKRTNKPHEETHSLSDDQVIDLYCANDRRGWRISSRGFDFTCLGADKSLLAADNMKSLIGKLRTAAPSAAFVGNYNSSRRLLEPVWPLETTREASGVQRSGFGRIEISSSSTVSNLRQFNKFSHLQHHLL